MADDLDKYLSDLGIDPEEEAKTPAMPTQATDAPEATPLASPPASSAPLQETFIEQQPMVRGDTPLERCESFLVTLLLNLDPAYAADVREVEGGIHANITGGDSGKLIGRGGRTLTALEYVTSAVVNKDDARAHTRVFLDVAGYKQRRDDRLRGVALKAAARVKKTGFAVELEPMSAAERRVIHMSVADDPGIVSESAGEGNKRRVVIKPR